MEQRGWIKLYRKLLHSPIFSSEKGLKVWVWCLLKSSHGGYEQYVGRSLVQLKSGQFVFGRQKASGELRMKESTVWGWIKQLKNDGYIDIKTYSKYSVISVLNWGEYQGIEQQTRQQIDNKTTTKNPSGTSGNDFDSKLNRLDKAKKQDLPTANPTTNEQQMNTNKNDKEINNIYSSQKCLTDKLCFEIATQYSVDEKPVKDLRDDLIGYCKSEGKQYKDYKATLQNWVRKAIRERKISKKISFESTTALPEISEEERLKNMEMLSQMRERFTRRILA